MTLCDLVTVFAETKSVTKSWLHCSLMGRSNEFARILMTCVSPHTVRFGTILSKNCALFAKQIHEIGFKFMKLSFSFLTQKWPSFVEKKCPLVFVISSGNHQGVYKCLYMSLSKGKKSQHKTCSCPFRTIISYINLG